MAVFVPVCVLMRFVIDHSECTSDVYPLLSSVDISYMQVL